MVSFGDAELCAGITFILRTTVTRVHRAFKRNCNGLISSYLDFPPTSHKTFVIASFFVYPQNTAGHNCDGVLCCHTMLKMVARWSFLQEIPGLRLRIFFFYYFLYTCKIM